MKKQNGFIAITAVLVLSALFLSLTIEITTRTIGSLQNELAYEHGQRARLYAQACMEHAFIQVVHQLQYKGEEIVHVDESGECEILPIAQPVSGVITIQSKSIVSGHIYRVQSEVVLATPEISIREYRAIIDF